MTDEPGTRGFHARLRAVEPTQHQIERLLEELTRLRSRFDRAARDGRDAFVAPGSDSYDIGMLAVIHLADFVTRELPDEVAAALPGLTRDGLRATRNIAAHNHAGFDNARLWSTVSEHATALLDQIESVLRAQ